MSSFDLINLMTLIQNLPLNFDVPFYDWLKILPPIVLLSVFFWLDHFAKRYLDKLGDVQCHRNVTELEMHIEHYQNERF